VLPPQLEVELAMRFIFSAIICVIALYVVDALYCDGVYFDAAREMAAHWRQHF
jgi:hypothetical protein